jgi:glutamyl-tRNA synthetase
MPQGTIEVYDLVRGAVSFNTAELGDFIIIKSDGFPTYNFACVIDDHLMGITHVIRGQEHLMNTPGQQAMWQALGFGQPPKYAHMSVTISDSGGKLSKRERPLTLRKAIKARPDIYLDKLAEVGGINTEQLKEFIAGDKMPDMPAVEAMAKYLGVELPEINVVDFFKSGYIPEAMVNFLALLGWSTGEQKEIMPLDELIALFDITRLTKSNSLFDRDKLVAFNTEHIKMLPKEKLLAHFKAYLKVVDSPVAKADDEMLLRLIKICEGARTLADIEHKCRFLFIADDKIEYDPKAVQKVLKAPNFMLGVNPQDKPGGLPYNGLAMLKIVREKLEAMAELTEQGIEDMLRALAEQNNVGLGKVAQPLRVAITGTTVSPPIFDSVQLLGKQNTLARIDTTLKKFAGQS